MPELVALDQNKPFEGLFALMTKQAGGNILNLRTIAISSSSTSITNSLPNLVDAKPTAYIQTKSKKGHYITFDFKVRQIQITGYTLQSAPLDANLGHLSNWQIYGSVDGEEWNLLDQIKNCESLNSHLAVATFPISNTDYYRFIKLRMSGCNTAKNARLILQRVEFFGKIRGVPIDPSPFSQFDQASLETYRTQFNAADSDGNGTLDLEELCRFFTETLKIKANLAPLAYRVCDRDVNGSISFDEFVSFYHKFGPLCSANPLPAYRLLFEAVDSQNLDKLNFGEIKQFLIYLQIEAEDPIIQEIIVDFDKDGDGRLTYDELLQGFFGIKTDVNFYQAHSYSPEEKTKLRAQFSAIDTDGNGTLDFDEMTIFCKKLIGDGGKEMAEMIFLTCDDDHNGVISFDEFVQFNQMVLAMQTNEFGVYKKIFHCLDVERSSTLDALALNKFYKFIQNPMEKKELEQYIKAHDSDNDGRLTFEQAIVCMKEPSSESED